MAHESCSGPEPANDEFTRLRDLLGLGPEDEPLLREALTHPSTGESVHQQRLEFLGDSVLALLSSEYLYRRYPDRQEGALTRRRQQLVRTETLADAGARLGLGLLLRLGQGEELAGGRERRSTLADAFEAVLAALYLTRGLDACRSFLEAHLFPHAPEIEAPDAKSRLQEWWQERHRLTPHYETDQVAGAAHLPTFESRVFAGTRLLGSGQGTSKKAAEQAAAAAALAAAEADEAGSTPERTG